MKKLKLLLSQSPTWKFSKNKTTLTSNDEMIVELKKVKHSKATFELDDKEYVIKNEGFWNPKTLIENNGKQILVLKRHFLGMKGEIEFENGKKYLYKIKNSPLIKLTFLTENNKEILYYKLDGNLKPKTIISITDLTINEKELLLLIILGCHSFKGIIKENDDADFITIVAGA